MNGSAPSAAGVEAAPGSSSWRVRPAVDRDVPAVAAAVGELLRELGSAPPAMTAMEAAARVLLEDRESGALLVADSAPAGAEADGGNAVAAGGGGASAAPAGGAVVDPLFGVLGASWQSAIHVPGSYALIQDLWVHPSWRGCGVGGGLLAALFELARERGVPRVEVGLPREHFVGYAATEAFYLANGFTSLGARMRWSLT
jgi:GNAT superfamily N-acetyltransferase